MGVVSHKKEGNIRRDLNAISACVAYSVASRIREAMLQNFTARMKLSKRNSISLSDVSYSITPFPQSQNNLSFIFYYFISFILYIFSLYFIKTRESK